jgi:hypothetical protein
MYIHCFVLKNKKIQMNSFVVCHCGSKYKPAFSQTSSLGKSSFKYHMTTTVLLQYPEDPQRWLSNLVYMFI